MPLFRQGGQKVQKTSNQVILYYAPMGLTVRCHRERKRSLNCFLALRELIDRVEMRLSPGTSERLLEFERMRTEQKRSCPSSPQEP